MTLCCICRNKIVGKGPQARVCRECQKERQRQRSKKWGDLNPRKDYQRQYHLANREERNERTRERMKAAGPVKRRFWNKQWRDRHALVIKIKRELGLRTMDEARKLLNYTKV